MIAVMGKKRDIQQIETIAKEFKMTQEERRDFGDFLEIEIIKGQGGTKNDRVDFTYEELRQKAREFLGLS